MDAKCKVCSTGKDEKKMLRQKFPTKDLTGKVFYGAFHYWYFCNDNCFNQYHEEQAVT